MDARLRFFAPLAPCEYLPAEVSRLEYLQVDRMAAGEYLEFLRRGWRRFGHVVFRPSCPFCRKCQSLRVLVSSFEPHRTQRRIWKANRGKVTLTIGEPSPSDESRALYEKFHRFQ